MRKISSMSEALPQLDLLLPGAAFVLGWVAAKIRGRTARAHDALRDPRDDRIRSLEAELRVARSGNEKLTAQLEDQKKELADTRKAIVLRKEAAGLQEQTIERLREDLRDSVRKTRDLRTELTDRAAEAVRLEMKVRELDTELSIAQSSPSLLAAGLMDYDREEGEPDRHEATGGHGAVT